MKQGNTFRKPAKNPEADKDIRTRITGLKIWPTRMLLTTEGRIPINEDDFVQYHQLLFPGDPISGLIRPSYSPEFARTIYIEAHRNLPLLTTNIGK